MTLKRKKAWPGGSVRDDRLLGGPGDELLPARTNAMGARRLGDAHTRPAVGSEARVPSSSRTIPVCGQQIRPVELSGDAEASHSLADHCTGPVVVGRRPPAAHLVDPARGSRPYQHPTPSLFPADTLAQ